jgi:hypothetical protein
VVKSRVRLLGIHKQSWLKRRSRMERVANLMIFKLISAPMVAESVFALVRLKSG